MNWTIPKVIALVAATSVLTAITSNLLTPRVTPSPSGIARTPAQPRRTRQQFSLPDPQALAELQSKVLDRQALKDTTGEIAINLKPYVNCKLTDPLADQPAEEDHTLAALPTGVNIYGGVPFDVQGIIQLNGPSVKNTIKLWPLEVKGIAIGHPFKKLHLLHGAFNINSPRGHPKYAKLILHYADGSQAELALIGGTHALRCVGQTISTDQDMLHAPQTELAWLGTNPYLDTYSPGESIHLYRTTIDNPNPDSEVTTIDYLTTMVNPAPFIVGLTIE